MSNFSFLHAADIHLDSPLKGLSRYEGLPLEEIRNATRRALDRLIDTALEEKVNFLILAGDLYDGSWQDVSTGLYMMKSLSRLVNAGIRVITLSGNHDAQSVIARELPRPPGIDHFSYNAPETVRLEDIQVALHGQSFRDRHVRKDMTPAYPAPVPGWFNIGVLHTSLSGYGEHETYAPCSIETLTSKHYDYWALGHVHAQQIVCRHPWIVFPGVLQGRHIRETGSCGAVLVTVENNIVQSVTPVACDVVRWTHIVIDIADMHDMEDINHAARRYMEKALTQAEERTVIARVTLTGASSLHDSLCASTCWQDDLRSIAVSLDTGQNQIALEKLRNKTTSLPSAKTLHDVDAALAELISDPEFLAMLPEEFEMFFSALPSCVEKSALMADDSNWPLEEARSALRARLMGSTT